MRCSCCDEELTDVDSTAKFSDGRFVDMCRECRGFLPSDVKVNLRRDLLNNPREVNFDAPQYTEWERLNMRAEDWDDS